MVNYMMIEIAVTVICALLFFIISLLLLKRENHRICLCVDNVVIIAFVVIFSFLFPFDYLYSVNNDVSNNSTLLVISSFIAEEIIGYYVVVLIFLIPFLIVFRLVLRNNDKKIPVFLHKSTSSNAILLVAIIMLLIGFITDRLYIKAYGSYSNYLLESNFIRSGASTFDNKWSFLIPFRGCVYLSCILLFSTLFSKGKYCFIKILLFLFSFVYSFLILYSNKGRLSIILFLFIFPTLFVILKFKPKHINIKIFILAPFVFIVFGFLVVLVGDLVSRSSNQNIFYTIAGESSFLFKNFKLLITKTDSYEYRFFSDIVAFPLFLLPSSVWGKYYTYTASDICTILFSGSVKGTNGVYGESPCDLISLGFLQLNVIGVFGLGIVFGFLSGIIFSRVRRIEDNNFRNTILVYLTIYLMVHSIFYCDPYLIVKKMIPGIVLLIVVLALSFFGVRFKEREVIQDI